MIRIGNLVPYSCRHMWNCGNFPVVVIPDIQEEKHFPRNNQLRAFSLLQLKTLQTLHTHAEYLHVDTAL